MTLRNLLADGRIRSHKPSAKEIADLLRLVKRDLTDAGLVQLSPDRRFATAYNASLQLATIALHAAGYQTSGASHHWLTFHVLPEIMGTQYQARADYFDNCRTKRNLTDYDRAGEISKLETEEIIAEALAFRDDLISWLKKNYPALFANGS